MSRLVSFPALISAELDIEAGAPTVNDLVHLLNEGLYTLTVYEPHGGDLSIVIREEKPCLCPKGMKYHSFSCPVGQGREQ